MDPKGPEVGHSAPQQKALKKYGGIDEQGAAIAKDVDIAVDARGCLP